jgi:hypothetical protein
VDATVFFGIAGAPGPDATAFALTIPSSLLQRADQVIE